MPTGNSYSKIKHHVSLLAKETGRNPKDISIIAVSKNFPWEHVSSAYEIGCKNFGENKIPEALQKISEAPKDIKWHFLGTLQKNKVRKAVGSFELIHSVDSLSLAEKISQTAKELKYTAHILLQVNTSGEATKHGLAEEEWRKSFQEILALPNLSVDGLMTIAPFTHDDVIVRDCFRKLRFFKEELNKTFKPKNKLFHLSMGMTNDYPIAIQEGATLLRIGSAIFGERPK